jgi:hypothetical protein
MSTAAIYGIAPDLFRLTIYAPDFDMQFNHFLVRDENRSFVRNGHPHTMQFR